MFASSGSAEVEFVEAPWAAARLWQAISFGVISGGLLWTLGLARAHGGAVAAAMLAAVFLAAGWNPALLLAVALAAAGVACRVAERRQATPAVPIRLGIAGTTALTAVAIAVAWWGWLSGNSGHAAVSMTGALAGSTALWWARATSTGPGLAAAFGLAAIGWWLGLLGPGDGFLPVVGAAAALPIVRSIRPVPRREVFLASLVAAGIAGALVALLP